MARDIKRFKTEKGRSASAWRTVVPLWKGIKNWAVFVVAYRVPVPWKPWWLRRMGVKVGKNVQVMPLTLVDIFFPNLIEIGDNTIIGMDAFLSCHEFTVDEFKYGGVKIGKNVLIGARSYILPGVEIGDNSIVSAQTIVYKSIPKNTWAFGSPMQFKKIRKK